MKVLMQSRVNLFKNLGGDSIQILKTKEYLEKIGAMIDISTELNPNLSSYDLVHLFNLNRPQEVYEQARNARKQNKKIFLSTIYGKYTEYDKKGRFGAYKFISKFLNNSQLQDFGVKIKNYMVIPNAIDRKMFDVQRVVIDEYLNKFKYCVLCVARIEGRKNQLNVVRAMKNLPYKLVLIGDTHRNNKNYLEMIKKEAGDNVFFLGKKDQEFISKLYKLAKIHVLASWMESTGLSSLEAGAMDCNLVIGDRGYIREYFKDYAYYCDPGSVESIKKAIIKAYESPLNPKLKEHILNNYTWEITAKKTLQAYKKVCEIVSKYLLLTEGNIFI